MKYQGIIPEVQKTVQPALPHWQYGVIEDGVKRVDPLLHYGCFTLGFDYPQIIDKVSEVMKNIKPEIAEVVGYGDIRLNPCSYELQQRLHTLTGYYSFYALSGSDANEGAVKLASAYHHERGNTKKSKVLSMTPSYHGSTYFTSSLGCDSLMEDPFYNFKHTENVIRVDRDFEIGEQHWDSIGAIMVETCTYGDDMIPYTDEFWNKLTYIQQTYDVLIIIDDIFMGGGKTGHYVGWKHLPVQPDIFTMGKAITGGFFPLSITLYNDKIKNCLPPNFKWEHGFTYNFSIPGIVSAIEYLDIVVNRNLIGQHPGIVNRARKTFIDCGYTIVSQFGTYFIVQKFKFKAMYMIPLNANEQYFKALSNEINAQ